MITYKQEVIVIFIGQWWFFSILQVCPLKSSCPIVWYKVIKLVQKCSAIILSVNTKLIQIPYGIHSWCDLVEPIINIENSGEMLWIFLVCVLLFLYTTWKSVKIHPDEVTWKLLLGWVVQCFYLRRKEIQLPWNNFQTTWKSSDLHILCYFCGRVVVLPAQGDFPEWKISFP